MPDNAQSPTFDERRTCEGSRIDTHPEGYSEYWGYTEERGYHPPIQSTVEVNDIPQDHNSGDGVPCYTIACQSLPDDVQSTFINTRSGSLQPGFCQIKRMSCKMQTSQQTYPQNHIKDS
jgi:hypothetical protein